MDLSAQKAGTRARIVISYARADADALGRLVGLLQGAGLSFGYDHRVLEGDSPWWQQFADVVTDADHFVLLLSPTALASKYIRAEWEHARRVGTLVSPVRATPRLDMAAMPLWMRDAHHYQLADDESCRQLLGRLEREPLRWAAPNMVPEMAARRFVARPAVEQAALAALLDPAGDPVPGVMALWGPGGFGKTALAARIGRDSRIASAFHDGVLWVPFSEQAADPRVTIAGLIRALTGRDMAFNSAAAAEGAWREALGARRCLLILEDVWREADIGPFLPSPERPDRAARLVTTRNAALLPPGWTVVPVDDMTPAEALAMLARDLPPAEVEANTSALENLADGRLGRWPLLLDLGNRYLLQRLRHRMGLGAAVAGFEDDLAARGVPAVLPPDERTDPRRSVVATVELSLAALGDPEAAERCRALAVLHPGASPTVRSAAWLWGVGENEAEALCADLRDLALLSDLDLGERRQLRLHDRIREILAAGLGEAARDRHARFADAVRRHAGGDWRGLRDDYALRFLPWHMAEAGDLEGRDRLLLDPAWMMAKLAGPGIGTLLGDYDE